VTATEHAAVVAGIYEAFGRADIDALLAPLADDISWDADWADSFAHRARIDMLAPRRGKAAVAEFFATLATYEVHDFKVLDLLASDRQVAVQVVIEVSYPHGGRYRDEEVHLWTFDADGTIVALRHYVDTAKHIAAARGENTMSAAAVAP
jgi:ketosteroid isomerase-like protein